MKTLAGARADRADDSTKWSVADMLREVLAQIEAGTLAPTSAILVWMQDDPNGKYIDDGWYAANTNGRRSVWMLEATKLKMMLEKS